MIVRRLNLLTCSYSKMQCIFRHCSAMSNTTRHLLSDYFGLTSNQANHIINKYRLHRIKHDYLLETLKFLHETGFSKDEVLGDPNVLKMHPVTIEQKYLTLQESGFKQISPTMLTKCRRLFSKNVVLLKLGGYIPVDLNVAENYKQYLKPLPDDFDVSDLADDQLLIEIYCNIVKRYLVWRLETNMDEIERMLRLYPVIRNKSLRLLCQNLEMLEDLNFGKHRILKYGYVITVFPKHTRTLLQEFSNIAGADLRKCIREYPKLLRIPLKNYVKIYGILKEHDIPDETIRNTMDIFYVSPETLKLRLQEIKNTPELRVLLFNSSILKLIVHHNRSKTRLSFLQELELKCASLFVLGSTPNNFDLHIKEGKDMNPYKELFSFLRSLLQVKEIDLNKFKKHPYYQNIPYIQMEETYSYLKSLQFSNSAILKALYILLYPREHIENALSKIREHVKKNVQKLTQVQRLNLIMYFIEKEHHFTGNGVWRSKKDN